VTTGHRRSGPDDDPDWNDAEWDIVVYLRTRRGYLVGPGGPTPAGRRYDFTVNRQPAEGKTLSSGHGSKTMVSDAAQSTKRRGQASWLIVDVRPCHMGELEARRSVGRITKMFGSGGIWARRLSRVTVIGDSYFIEEAI
jgi:hypothetical protein